MISCCCLLAICHLPPATRYLLLTMYLRPEQALMEKLEADSPGSSLTRTLTRTRTRTRTRTLTLTLTLYTDPYLSRRPFSRLVFIWIGLLRQGSSAH